MFVRLQGMSERAFTPKVVRGGLDVSPVEKAPMGNTEAVLKLKQLGIDASCEEGDPETLTRVFRFAEIPEIEAKKVFDEVWTSESVNEAAEAIQKAQDETREKETRIPLPPVRRGQFATGESLYIFLREKAEQFGGEMTARFGFPPDEFLIRRKDTFSAEKPKLQRLQIADITPKSINDIRNKATGKSIQIEPIPLDDTGRIWNASTRKNLEKAFAARDREFFLDLVGVSPIRGNLKEQGIPLRKGDAVTVMSTELDEAILFLYQEVDMALHFDKKAATEQRLAAIKPQVLLSQKVVCELPTTPPTVLVEVALKSPDKVSEDWAKGVVGEMMRRDPTKDEMEGGFIDLMPEQQEARGNMVAFPLYHRDGVLRLHMAVPKSQIREAQRKEIPPGIL